MVYVTDTHAVVWFLESDARLGREADSVLSNRAERIVVPTLVLAEIQFLYTKKRIRVSLEETLSKLRRAENCTIYPLDELVASNLPQELDIHDGIIVATALVQNEFADSAVVLVTRDRAIRESGLVTTIW